MNAWWTRYLPVVVREWLDGRQQLQKTIGNTGWLLGDRIVRLAGGVIISAWIARYLGPSQYGQLAFVISFIAFFQVFATLEADGFIVRDIAQEQDEPALILGSALWLRFLFGAGAWLVATAVIFALHPHDTQLVMLAFIVGSTLVFQASDTVDLWFQSQSQSKRTVVAKLTAYLLTSGIKVVLLLQQAPLVAFAATMCLEGAASAVGLALAYRRYPTARNWQRSQSRARMLLKLCWPFMFSGFMITVYMRIDQIMLKEMLGERELGIFVAAVTLSNLWSVIPGILVTSLAPYVARKMVEGEEPHHDALAGIFRVFAVTAACGAALTALASSWIVELLYGERYLLSADVLRIHVFANIFVFIGMAQHLWMVNKNATLVTMFSTTCSALVGIAANLVLIREFGVMGAVYSYLLVQACSVVVAPCLARRDLRAIYLRAFLPRKAVWTR